MVFELFKRQELAKVVFFRLIRIGPEPLLHTLVNSNAGTPFFIQGEALSTSTWQWQ